MINPTSFYLGQEVIWHDEHGNSIGPGTVLDVRPTPGSIMLSVLEHSTQLYQRVSVSHDGVERVQFSDEQVEALPRIVLDEIRCALEYGNECAVDQCGESRIFSDSLCLGHALGQDEGNWPDFHDEAPDWVDDGLPDWMI